MKSLILHSCCGPCSTIAIERLTKMFDISILYYNPNIDSLEEFDKRLNNQRRFILEYRPNIKLIEVEYDHRQFLSYISEHELDIEGGKRCKLCIRLRLEKTNELRKLLGIDLFTTTLSVSPYKDSKYIVKIGKEIDNSFYEVDFSEDEGYLKSLKLSKEYSLYRQKYCGCEFSKSNIKRKNV